MREGNNTPPSRLDTEVTYFKMVSHFLKQKAVNWARKYGTNALKAKLAAADLESFREFKNWYARRWNEDYPDAINYSVYNYKRKRTWASTKGRARAPAKRQRRGGRRAW